MANKLLGVAALGAAAYFMRNKETREKTINQIKSYVDPQTVEKVKNTFQNMTKSTPSDSVVTDKEVPEKTPTF